MYLYVLLSTVPICSSDHSMWTRTFIVRYLRYKKENQTKVQHLISMYDETDSDDTDMHTE